jgi:hypothetical protein
MSRNLWCTVLGHRWKRTRQRGRVLLTCRRCGHVDAVTQDFSSGFGGIGG